MKLSHFHRKLHFFLNLTNTVKLQKLEQQRFFKKIYTFVFFFFFVLYKRYRSSFFQTCVVLITGCNPVLKKLFQTKNLHLRANLYKLFYNTFNSILTPRTKCYQLFLLDVMKRFHNIKAC